MSPARQLGLAVVACAAGAGLALFAASRTWVVEYTQRPVPLPPLMVSRTGAALDGLLPALAVVALAAAGGLLATRSWARVVVGVVAGLCGLGLVVSALSTGSGAGGVGGWPVGCVAGGVVVVVAGALAVVRGRGWPVMGARYERGVSRRVGPDAPAAQLWDAIDRGEDPTVSPDRVPSVEGEH